MTNQIFEGARKTHGWAKDELAKLKEGMLAFGETQPYEVSVEHGALGPRGPDEILVAKVVKPAPQEIERGAYRIVSDLRNCLDQACHAASEALSGVASKYTNFPIASDERNFRAQIASDRGPYRGIPAALHDTLLGFKPWPASDDGNDLLHFLNDLANGNKHRIPLRVTVEPYGVGVYSASDMSLTLGIQKRSDTEFQFMTIRPTGPNPWIRYHIDPYVMLSDPGPFPDLHACALFEQMADETDRVISALEAAV